MSARPLETSDLELDLPNEDRDRELIARVGVREAVQGVLAVQLLDESRPIKARVARRSGSRFDIA